MNFLFGLIGLSLMVVIHELGHFIFAKIFKVKVKAFSVGMGPKIFGYTYKETEYRLSLLPLGGYCAMEGEEDFATALEKNKKYIEPTEGSLYFVAPWKRLVIAIAGPFFNLISAILIFIATFLIGSTITTNSNRIVLASDFDKDEYAADIAGLKTGDYITEIDGNKIEYNYQILENVVFNPDKILTVKYIRDAKEFSTQIKPILSKNTGEAKIGIYAWVDAVVKNIKPGSRAFEAGLNLGDKITKVNGVEIKNSMDFMQQIKNGEKKLNLEVVSSNNIVHNKSIFLDDENPYMLGITFEYIKVKKPSLGLKSIPAGLLEPFNIVKQQLKGFSMLGRIDINNAVQGPIRITNLIGDVVVSSFSSSFFEGLTNSLKLIAIISVILCFMNLLPIPALDGGLIILSLLEIIRRKKFTVKFMKYYQIVGLGIILLLTVLILSNEFIYYIKNLF